nr:hypothetical protein [Tanacetum cinerariifolium]
MASFDYRLNPLYPIKECSPCVALYTTDYCCSNGSLGDKIICDLDKTHDLSQHPPQNYPMCGNPVDGYYCQGQPFIVEQDPGKNSSQSPPHINHHCCYDCGDPLEVTPSLSTEEPDNSLSMGDEHLDTILATESGEFIKSSIESLVPILSESEGIPDNMCDMPFHDNSPPLDVSKDQFEDLFDSNDDSTSNDDDSFSIKNIEYVEASPPNYELVSSVVMEIVIPKVGGIDDDILLTIKDDILREKLLNVNLLIANIEALKYNPAPSSNFMTKSSSTSLNSLLGETITFDNYLPEFETFCFDLKEISSGSTTTHSDISLPEYEAFYDNHAKEISSGSTTTHSDSSLYDRSSLIFRSIHFLLPIGVISMSSLMNSLTSYLHHSMIVSVSRMNLLEIRNELLVNSLI